MDRGYEEKEKILDSTIVSQYSEQTKTDHSPPPPPPAKNQNKQTNKHESFIFTSFKTGICHQTK